MKMLIRLAVPFALLLSAAAHAVESHAVIFMYHRFGDDRYPSTNIRLAQFDAQLDWLQANGYHVWPLERITAFLETGKQLPDKTVAITVDDAYETVYRHAWPRLRARGWPLTVFVATDPVDRGTTEYMSWGQMREMAAFGVRFANHSASHDHLVELQPGETRSDWKARIGADLQKAQRRLSEELGAAALGPRFLAYPYGEFDEALARVVRQSGFIAFGQQSGAVGIHSDLRALPRYPMAEAFAALEPFAMKASSLALPVVDAAPWGPTAPGTNPPRLVLSLAESEAALDRLACYTGGGEPIPVERLEPLRFAVRAREPLPPGRSRYNCTAPHRQENRFYWYSHPWITRRDGDAPER